MELTAVEQAARDGAAERDAGLPADARRSRGVVHTPPELARFIAGAVHQLLRSELGLPGGLASPRVTLLDPAVGPGAFLAAALAVGEEPGGAPARVIGCDVDAAALDTAGRVLDAEHARRGWPLELHALDTLADPGFAAALAADADILVILGNPPWVGGSRLPRPSPELAAWLEDFRRDADGVRLPERKLGVLSDLYVRFLCWSAQVARLARGGAVLGIVSNGSFVDGLMHRAMRGALCRWFPALHLVDLGGNAMLSSAGARDENVFGVRPSAAITLAVRAGQGGLAPRVRYSRLVGSRASKLATLGASDLAELPAETVAATAPRHELRPRTASVPQYADWPSLADAMPFHREGVQSNRDALVTDTDRTRLLERLHALANGTLSLDAHIAHHFDPEAARRLLQERLARDPDGSRGLSLRRLAYRPLDARWFAPVAPLCHRPRPDLLRAFDHEPLALVSVRKDRGTALWAHVGVVDAVPDGCYLSARSSCRTRAFPVRDAAGQLNFAPGVANRFAERCGRAPSAQEFLHYALAVLWSARYRQRLDSELRLDYPRLPLPHDATELAALVAHGARLQALLLASAGPAQLAALAPELDSTVEQLLHRALA